MLATISVHGVVSINIGEPEVGNSGGYGFRRIQIECADGRTFWLDCYGGDLADVMTPSEQENLSYTVAAE